MSMDTLPNEILSMILRYTNVYMLCCVFVCKTWRRICMPKAKKYVCRLFCAIRRECNIPLFVWAKNIFECASHIGDMFAYPQHQQMIQTLNKQDLLRSQREILLSLSIYKNTENMKYFLQITQPDLRMVIAMKKILLNDIRCKSGTLQMLELLIDYECTLLGIN